MTIPATPERPMRIATVGSGPSGFYAAEALLGAEPTVEVDMYDSLPAPFGLVRYGVAPDHAKIKNIIARYEKTAGMAGFAFFGNVNVGIDITVTEMRKYYDAIVFACGAQTDRKLGIPGEDLPGSHTATEFVAWYNGHPDCLDRQFDLSHEVAVVIGQGNVAIDVARILCKTVDELKHTDIAEHALQVLAESRVREVHMVGRRGPVQAAFTPPEIKEFGLLEDCEPVVAVAQLELGDASRAELEELKWRDSIKNYDRLTEYAEREPSGKARQFVVDFYASPKELVGDGRVEGVVFERNRLAGDAGKQWAEGTGETYLLECGSFFRSVGYRGVPIEGIPFEDKRGVFPNNAGRLTDGGTIVPGLYAVGWIKRGPSGVIGTNKPDANETVKLLLEDLPTLVPCESPRRGDVMAMLKAKGVRVVDYDAWRRIDACEIARGESTGKPREKFVTIGQMLEAAE